MKRLVLGVGIAMSAIAMVAGMPGSSRSAFADGPDIGFPGLDDLSGATFGDLSDLPTEPTPAAAPQNPAPAAPIEEPVAAADIVNPQITDAVTQSGSPSGAVQQIGLPSTGTGAAEGGGQPFVFGLALLFAVAGLGCIAAIRRPESVRTLDH